MPLKNVVTKVKQQLGVGANDAPGKSPAAASTKKAAAAAGTFADQENALKPAASAPKKAAPAGLPESTAELQADAAFKVAVLGAFAGEQGIPKQYAKMLVEGIAAEGVSDAKTLAEALESYVDEGALTVLSVQKAGGAHLTWLRFYAGDTEVGYIFNGATMTHMVSDGSISAR